MGLHRFATVVAVASVAIAVFASASSVEDVPLFEYETKKLEDVSIGSKYADVFAFDTTGPTIRPGECKPRPGDYAWPSQKVWDAFDEALGGVLIRTVPLAAPCYKNWGVYDSGKCHSIINNWTNPYLQ